MDLNEQAERAVDEAFAYVCVVTVPDSRAAARLVWLDGYEAGVKAAKAKVEEAAAQWQAAQS